MQAKEALELLKSPLKFGDAVQIRAREALERIYEVRDAILACEEDHHWDFKHEKNSYRGKRLTKAALLEDLEDTISECENCWKLLPRCYADELLAAVALLLDKWWEEN